MLKLICPLATEMSRLVGMEVECYRPLSMTAPLQVLELGGGTGITTLNLLNARDDIHIVSVDNEPVMQDQARQNLAKWAAQGVLSFCTDDALTALRNIPEGSVDIVASAYTLHNFSQDYRYKVICDIYRVLRPGGCLINGDRYALDDVSAHTRLVQEEVCGYFAVLGEMQRLDLLEKWIVHLLSDESENHVMREGQALALLQEAGFVDVSLTHRQQVNALLTAAKPA